MDMLSRILADTHLHSSLMCDLALRDGVAIDYETASGIAAHYIQSGKCWLELPHDEPILLGAGDFVMLPRWPEHALSLSLGNRPAKIRALVERSSQPIWFPGLVLDQPIRLDAGEGTEFCRVISMIFHVWDPDKNPVLTCLPEVAHLSPVSGTTQSLLETVTRFIEDERNSDRKGYAVISNKLADLVFTQTVREQLQSHPSDMTGFLRGLADPALSSLLPMLHGQPEAHWTLASMAAQCGLSRSAFAMRFKNLIGITPRAYLNTLRMTRSAELLRHGKRVKVVSDAAGFRSEQAFATAFRRAFSETPGKYRTKFIA
jgi:AraC-like DNA-binding protein